MLQRRPWIAVALALGALGLTGCGQIPRPSLVQNLLPGAQEKSSQKLDAQLSLARLSERTGDKQTAEQIYQAALKNYPPNQLVHHRLGVLAAQQSRFEEAAEHFDTAARLGPPSSDLMNDFGYNLYLMDRRPEAESAFRRALEINPQNKSARANLAMLLGESRRFDESLAEFRRAGTEAEAQANLGYVKTQTGDLDGAVACYHRALALDDSLKPAAEALLQLTRHQAELKAKSPGNAPDPAVGKRVAGAGPDSAPPEGNSAVKATADAQAKASRLIDTISLSEPGSGRGQPARRNAARPNAKNQPVAYVTDEDTGVASTRNQPVRDSRNDRTPAPQPTSSSEFQRQRSDAGRSPIPPLVHTGTPSPQHGPAMTSRAVPTGEPTAGNPAAGQPTPTSPECRNGEAMFPMVNPLQASPVPMATDSPWQRPTWSPDLNATLLRNLNDPSSSASGPNVRANPDGLRSGPRQDGSSAPASLDGHNPTAR